jgi:hypothetical protein
MVPLRRRRVPAGSGVGAVVTVFAVGVSPVRAEEGFPVVSAEQEREASQIVLELIDAVGRVADEAGKWAAKLLVTRLEREADPTGALSPAERAPLVRPAARRLSAELHAAKARKRSAGA